MTGYLEINDIELRAFDAQGNLITQSTAGAAWLDQQLVFGQQAIAQSRIRPQHFNQRYLANIGSQPLQTPLGTAQNHADLIYQHLLALELPAMPWIVGIPGYLSNEQLGLLLGICGEAKISVASFIETGLVAALHGELPSRFHLLDIEQQRQVLSAYTTEGATRSWLDTNTHEGLGTSHITAGWMAVVADEFVTHTRFDPQHTGSTEQQLFDQVLAWYGTADLGDQRIQIGEGESLRSIEISRQLVYDKLSQRLANLDLAHVEELVVTNRVAKVPGLIRFLESRLGHITILEDTTDVPAIIALADSGQVRRLTQAPALAPTVAKQNATLPHATHLVARYEAKPLSQFGQTRSTQDGIALTLPNGDTHTLTVGHAITIDGESWVPIVVR